MNYGWSANREKEREREIGLLLLSSFAPWVREVSRCECCHADGDPGVLRKAENKRGN